MVNFDFPGEKYLLEELPDYDTERQMLVVKCVLAFLFWTIFMPFFLASEKHVTEGNGSGSGNTNVGTPVETVATTTTTTKSSSTRRRKTTTIVKSVAMKKQSRASKKNEMKMGKNDNLRSTRATDVHGTSISTVKVIDGYTNLFCCVGFIFHSIYLLLISSPDNYYTSRTVFETPLFSQSECDHLVGMAERVAEKNYEMAQKFVETEVEVEHDTNSSMNKTMMGYLKEPYGWQKTRHKFHPTTDLNLVTDNFSAEDRAWIQQRLDARLAPTLERIFGVPPSAIRANDVSDYFDYSAPCILLCIVEWTG